MPPASSSPREQKERGAWPLSRVLPFVAHAAPDGVDDAGFEMGG